jgi:hypothetical protein
MLINQIEVMEVNADDILYFENSKIGKDTLNTEIEGYFDDLIDV